MRAKRAFLGPKSQFHSLFFYLLRQFLKSRRLDARPEHTGRPVIRKEAYTGNPHFKRLGPDSTETFVDGAEFFLRDLSEKF